MVKFTQQKYIMINWWTDDNDEDSKRCIILARPTVDVSLFF